MLRGALGMERKRDYRMRDFKGWVVQQMHVHHKTQKGVHRYGRLQSRVGLL